MIVAFHWVSLFQLCCERMSCTRPCSSLSLFPRKRGYYYNTFYTSGLFMSLTETYIHQSINRIDDCAPKCFQPGAAVCSSILSPECFISRAYHLQNIPAFNFVYKLPELVMYLVRDRIAGYAYRIFRFVIKGSFPSNSFFYSTLS
jgi:hypothetical protein